MTESAIPRGTWRRPPGVIGFAGYDKLGLGPGIAAKMISDRKRRNRLHLILVWMPPLFMLLCLVKPLWIQPTAMLLMAVIVCMTAVVYFHARMIALPFSQRAVQDELLLAGTTLVGLRCDVRYEVAAILFWPVMVYFVAGSFVSLFHFLGYQLVVYVMFILGWPVIVSLTIDRTLGYGFSLGRLAWEPLALFLAYPQTDGRKFIAVLPVLFVMSTQVPHVLAMMRPFAEIVPSCMLSIAMSALLLTPWAFGRIPRRRLRYRLGQIPRIRSNRLEKMFQWQREGVG